MSSHENVEVSRNVKKCKYCKKKVVDSLDCEKCNSSFHPSCGYQTKVVDSSGKVQCCENIEKSEVSSGNFRESGELLANMDEKRIKNIIRDSLQQFLSSFEKKIDKKFDDFEKSIQYMSDSFEEQKVKFESVLVEVTMLRKENETLKHRLQSLESKFDDLEVKGKENNIVVVGVPSQDDSDTGNIVSKIVTAMQIPIGKSDIVDSFRLGRKEDGPILVKFRDHSMRKEILRKIKQMKGITNEKCHLKGENGRIYLNEDLPVNKRMLFKKARDIKKREGYAAAFCMNGVVYLRKNDQDPPIKIRNEGDLCL